MYRHKDRLLKQVRTFKKRNHNKEDKERDVGGTGGCISLFANDKVDQQHIEDITGLKIHKNRLRYSNDTYVEGLPYDNHTSEEMKIAIERLENAKLPKPEYTHDKTHWAHSKNRTRNQRCNREIKSLRMESFTEAPDEDT